MNEEAIKDAYNLFVRTGYNQDINTFKQLIYSNPEALQDAYGLFVRTGYNQDINAFKTLMGADGQMSQPQQEDLKKKGELGTTESPSVESLSVSQSTDENVPDFFKSSIGSIDTKLINETEEIVVPKLQYQFGPMGFKFEESGWSGDYMKVTAPNGKEIEISLDPYTDNTANAEAQKLQKFISDNTNVSSLSAIESQYKEANKKFTSDEDVNLNIKLANDIADSFRNDMEGYLKQQAVLEEERKYLESLPSNQPKDEATLKRVLEYDNNLRLLNKQKAELEARHSELSTMGDNLKYSVGEYTAMKAKQGTVLGAMWNEFLKGATFFAGSVVNTLTDIGAEVQPYNPTSWDGPKADVLKAAQFFNINVPNIEILKDINGRDYIDQSQNAAFNSWYSTLSEEEKNQIEDKVQDRLKKKIKYGEGDEIGMFEAAVNSYKDVFGTSTTKEFTRAAQDRSIINEALIGVSGSLPSMIGGGMARSFTAMGTAIYARATDAVYEEMSQNPNFDDISEEEKRLVAAPIGAAEAALEAIGLRNVIANKGLMNRAILAAIGKSGATTTAKTFGELVQNEIKSKLGKVGLTLAGAALAEAETGAAQQVSEYAFKDIFNAAKEKKIFNTPEFLSKEYFSDIGRAATAEAIGGLILGVPSSVSAAYKGKGFQGMDNRLFRVFEASAKDPEIEKAFIADLKTRVAKGELKPKEAKEILNNYRNSVGLFNSMPENLTSSQKKDAMNLLKEKKDLTFQIQGKDDALTRKQRDRIAAINDELTSLSEKAADNINVTLPSGAKIIVDPDNREEFDRLNEAYNKINRLKEKARENLLKDADTDEKRAEVETKVNETWQSTPLFKIQQEILAKMQQLDVNAPTKIFSTVESLTAALQSLPVNDRQRTIEIDDNGSTAVIDGNEKLIADLYYEAVSTPISERTAIQNDIIDSVKVSLKTPVIKESSTSWIDSIANDREITMQADSIDEIPEMFRQRAKETLVSEPRDRRKILGIPIGRSQVDIVKKYTYDVTGSEIKSNRSMFESLRAPRAATIAGIEANAIKSLQSVFPNVEVIYAKNGDDMRSRIAENHGDAIASKVQGDESGQIVFGINGEPQAIYLNEQNKDATTLAHEVWHAILFKAFGENPLLFQEFRNELTKILDDNGYGSIVSKLDAFVDSEEYKQSNSQAEEWLVQFGAYLAASGLNRENIATGKNRAFLLKLKSLFNKYANRIIGYPIFLEDATPDTILDFMITFSDRMARGESLSDLFSDNVTVSTPGGSRIAPQRMSIDALATDIENNYGASVDLFESSNGDITLSSIVIPAENRGKGIGGKVMADIINYADNNGSRILLTPSKSLGATSIDRLKSFYKELGFVDNKGTNKDFTTRESMYRNPLKTTKSQTGETGLESVEATTKALGGVDVEGIIKLYPQLKNTKAIDKNGQPIVLYHQTDNLLFDKDKGKYGGAIFFSAEPQGFLIRKNEIKAYVIAKKIFSTYSKQNVEKGAYKDSYGIYGVDKIPTNVYEGLKKVIKDNQESILKFWRETGTDSLEDVKERLINKGVKDVSNYDAIIDYINNWNDGWVIIEHPSIINFIKEKGYDSFITKEEGVTNIAVFPSKNLIDTIISPQSISEAYHKAKKDGSNPELVRTVEELLGKPTAKSQTGETGLEDEKIKEETNRAKVIEYNKKAKEDRGKNISVKDFDTIKKRGQNLKVGDVYARKIGDAVYVFKVLSNLKKLYGQFYTMNVEVLDTGIDYVRQELEPNFDIREVGKRVGDKTIDSFKNLASSSGGFNFGEVTVLQDYESKTAETTPTAKSQTGETGLAPKLDSVKNIDVKLVRTLSRAGKRISKGLSVYKRNKQKIVEEAPELSLEYVKENAPDLFINNANLIKNYSIIKGVKEFGNITTVEQAQEVYDIFSRQIADNLIFLMDNFRNDLREIATLWYDGANILAQKLGKQYGITTEQVAGIIASLSPQKDWYQNVRLAELVIMAFKDNPAMTQEMVNKQREISDIGLNKLIKEVVAAEKSFKKSRSEKRANKLKEAQNKLQELQTKTDKVIAELEKYIGTDMKTAPDYLKPYYARLYHEINTTKDYNILSPDGNILGVAKKKGGENAKVAWGSYTEIGKAVDIYIDGSQENITKTLGEMHKIRNFYNNIVDPMSPDRDVTMDTHAVAAALLLPLSGEAKQVKANFGQGTSNSAPLGIKGLYYAFAEGYNLAAKESGLLPRQVQSITWEAVRGLFTDEFKRNSKKVAEINAIADNYANKKITLDEARNQIVRKAGGIDTPSWATGGPVQDGLGEDIKPKAVGGTGKRVGPDTVGAKQGKPRVKKQINADGPSLFRTEEDAAIGFQYDTDKVARERFNIYQLKKIGSGSDRIVFDLGDGKVLKVAKTARGLEQNIYEGDGYLSIVPNIYERGLNYVVVDKIGRIKLSDLVPVYNEDGEQTGEVKASTMFSDLGQFSQRDFDSHRNELQYVLNKYGLRDVINYDVLWGDFTRSANWGYKDGLPYHIDGGTFGGVDMIKSFQGKKNLTDPDFREAYNRSRRAKKEFADTDAFTKFQLPSESDLKEIQRIARKYNMSILGFSPRQVNDKDFGREVAKFGFSTKRAKLDAYGRGNGVYLVDPRGRFFNPFAPKYKKSRVNLGASRLVDTGKITDIPGYDRMLDEVNGIIDRSRRRGHAKDRIMNSVMAYVMGSAVYTRADDSQREQLVRNVQTEFGKRLKSAPSAGKLLGTIKDVKKITLTEKELLKTQIKLLARGARTAIAAWRRVSRELSSEIKELATSGRITNGQAANAIRRLSAVNMFSQDSIDKFIEYMTKVFEDANYAEKINKAKKLLPNAKRNLKTKMGIANTVVPNLQQLFAINPNLIPDSVLDKYLSILEMVGQRAAVLTLQDSTALASTTIEILDAIAEEVSLVEELSMRFDNYADKVFDDDGNLDFAATLKSMVDSNTITEQDAELMRKYKSQIIPRVVPVEMTESEINAEKTVLIREIQSSDINVDGLPSRDERELGRQLVALLDEDILSQMSLPQLRNLIKLIDNINNGYLPHYAELSVERLDSFKNSNTLIESVESARPAFFSRAYARLKNLFTRKGIDVEMIRRSPLFYVDQVFGDYKTKKIFESIFKGISEAQSLFDSEIGKINKLLDQAHESVAKSFRYNSNKTLLSSYKMMTYMLQLEYNNNPGSNQVHQASKVIKATIKLIDSGNTKYGEREADMLSSILNDYADENGEIDADALYNSFNDAEKKAISTIQDINESVRDKAVYTAAVIRGDRINPLNNYVHHFVINSNNPDENLMGTQLSENYNNSLRPSTRGQSLIERERAVSPLNFDVFASAQRGAKFVLLDYTMTKPIRTARKTLAVTRAKLEESNNGRIPKEQRDVFNAIESAFDEVVRNVLTNNFITDSFADEVVNFISKSGYRAILASVPRFISELSSNIGFVMIANPKDFIAGTKYKSIVLSPSAVLILDNVGSKQTNRLFHGDTLGGRFIDKSVLSQSSGVKSATAKGDVSNVANMIYNLSLKKYKNAVELLADTLISTPDKLIMRPLWFGVFANEFKNQTGREVDFNMIASNNEVYMNENKEAIEAAKNKADEQSVLAGATDNPFMGMLKGTVKPNQSFLTRFFNNFNNFMTRFAIYEYTTARQGIYAAMGNGTITRKQGVALLSGVATRMTLYTLLTQVLGSTMLGLFGEDDEDDEKTFAQKFGQSLASTTTGLILGRDFGNATKSLINYGVELGNEKFLTALREGDYDPYKDAISYSIIPKEKQGKKTTLTDFITQMGGSFGPALKTADLVARKAFEPPKKEEEAIERTNEEIGVRIPLEVLGHLGLVPLYKDIRKVVIDQMYRDLEHADKRAADKKQAEKEMLHGYENKTDMKRYNPELYDDVFGKDSPGYNERKAKQNIKKAKEKLERQRKDALYEYSPKKKAKKETKSDFGSEKFGGEGTKKETKSDFGSDKFGKKD